MLTRWCMAVVWGFMLSGSLRADEPVKDPVTNSIGMKLALIPIGEFLMGSPESDKDAQPDEKPQHKVRITKPFLMGVTPVTNGQFRTFVKETGYQTQAEKGSGPWKAVTRSGQIVPGESKQNWDNLGHLVMTEEHPVVIVDYDDALTFCDWLSKKEAKIYRLPTEAEWEYACRAGTTTRWSCGDDKDALIEHAKIMWDGFPTFARQNSPTDNRWLMTAPVGSYKPNPWGLYDMHGNVWQWCRDWHGEDYYQKSPVDDPTGPREGETRVIRGGTWSRGPLDCRSANRFGLSGATSLWVGFRVVLEHEKEVKATLRGQRAGEVLMDWTPPGSPDVRETLWAPGYGDVAMEEFTVPRPFAKVWEFYAHKCGETSEYKPGLSLERAAGKGERRYLVRLRQNADGPQCTWVIHTESSTIVAHCKSLGLQEEQTQIKLTAGTRREPRPAKAEEPKAIVPLTTAKEWSGFFPRKSLHLLPREAKQEIGIIEDAKTFGDVWSAWSDESEGKTPTIDFDKQIVLFLVRDAYETGHAFKDLAVDGGVLKFQVTCNKADTKYTDRLRAVMVVLPRQGIRAFDTGNGVFELSSGQGAGPLRRD